MVTRLSALPLLLASIWFPLIPEAMAAGAVSLSEVNKIYVGSLGDKKGASVLRQRLIDAFTHSHHFTIATTPEGADAVIEGSGELWIRGYYSLNPRAHGSTRGAEPFYGGYLSVELKGNKDETIWSYLVTPGRFSSGDAAHDLAGEIVKTLFKARSEQLHEKK